MYTLITLRGDRHLFAVRAKSHQQYVRKGNHQISAVRTKKPGVYSSRLRQLVHRCIDPNPDARPTQLELLDATRRGLRLAERRLRRARREARAAADPENAPPPQDAAAAAADQNDVPEHSEKLYFQGHEINDMPLGDASFRPAYSEVDELVCGQFVNHDVRSLKLPTAKYGHFPKSRFWPEGSWKRLYDHSASGRLWCNAPLPQAQPQANANQNPNQNQIPTQQANLPNANVPPPAHANPPAPANQPRVDPVATANLLAGVGPQ